MLCTRLTAVQGKTVAAPTKVILVVDWAPPGLIYTAVSRVQSIQQFILVGAESFMGADDGGFYEDN
jgi:hypothetical protein